MPLMFKTIALIAVGVAAGQAFAAPDWDVIHRARAAAQYSSAANAAREAQLARCDEMLKQRDARPAGSNGLKGSAKSQ